MLRIATPISTVSVLAARYPISVGPSNPYASGTQTVSSPACSRATTWSAASRGLPEYISWVESFTPATVTEPLSRSQGLPSGQARPQPGAGTDWRRSSTLSWCRVMSTPWMLPRIARIAGRSTQNQLAAAKTVTPMAAVTMLANGDVPTR